ncbi:MAG: 7-cyano-7-deazaguanine synthase QueC [Hyphomicrobiales bacterium]|nr:7-cyano-7-deazaguanine synthase QueC [Hyphomicrobiales bacterium]
MTSFEKVKGADSAALVLFSGGQDSATCLAWALARYARVETVGFSYGQRHAVELDARADVLRRLRAEFPAWGAGLGEDHLIDIAALGAISDTALTSDAEIAFGANGLPTTFVPGRNVVFFTLAAALGYRRGLLRLVGGMCETDYSGYPDCRNETLRSLEETLRLATEARFSLELPLMWRSKADTWALAHALGGDALVELIVEATHTCYKGDRSQRHDWGYGCGQCPACQLRAAGWAASCATKRGTT